VDVKTLLLLGIGMAVLSLVGFCAARARSAEVVSCQRLLPGLDDTQPETGTRRLPASGRYWPEPMAASAGGPLFG
jgi:hypothetical protein